MAETESERRFEGAGQEFHAKYMGSVEIAKSKGQDACQEAMQKLLVTLKSRKEPKPRLIINLSYEGTRLKEMPPGINLLDLSFKHSQVSYVWKDPRDQRSLGIVRTEVDPGDEDKVLHRFHGIRTVKPAMPFLQEMQELFRIVKERAAQHKERAASVAATTAAVADEIPPQTPAADSEQPRERAISNLLGPDDSTAGLPKNESVASLDDLGDIFSASATVGQQPAPTGQPMGGGGVSNPFGQPMGGGGGGNSNPFGQPMGGGEVSNPFGQPMGGGGGGNPFGQQQPMGGGGQFGQQVLANVNNLFGQPQPMGGGGFAGQQQQYYQQQQQQQYYQQQQQQQYYQQQQQQQQANNNNNNNPFSTGGGFSYNRQSSIPAATGDEPLMPVSLNPSAAAKGGSTAGKPDAFSGLGVIGLGQADPKRQQVSGKELFKQAAAADKPKATLRDLANQSPRP